MLRILVLNYEFPPIGGGTGVACRHVLRHLARDPSVEIDLVTSGSAAEAVEEQPAERVRVFRLPVGKADPHYWTPIELARWTTRATAFARRKVRERRYHLSHCWSGWPAGVVGYLLRPLIPYVVSLRGSDVPGYNTRLKLLDPLLFRWISRAVWSNAREVVAVSRNLRGLAARTHSGLSIGVTLNGVDTSFFFPGSEPERFTVLCVARLIKRKQIDCVLRAVRDTRIAGRDCRLIVAGDGPERATMERFCRREGLDSMVEFRGHLDPESLRDVYHQASVLVLPAARDAMPNAALEGMASGLPLITARSGVAELIQDNGLITGDDPEAIRIAMQTYMDDPELRRRHGQASRTLAEHMTWQAVADVYRAVYDRHALRE